MTIPDINEVLKHYPEFKGVHPACLAVPMIDEQGFSDLVEDIKHRGLREPLLRMKGNLLLDGRTRLLACYVAQEEIRVKDDFEIIDPWATVNTLNIQRRQLTVGQKASFGDDWREAEDAAARERQLSTLKNVNLKEAAKINATHPNGPKEHRHGNVSITSGTARDKVGEKAGVSGRSMDKVRTIKRHAPEVAKEVKAGTKSLEEGYKEARQIERSKQDLPVEKPFTLSNSNTTTIVTTDGTEKTIPQPKNVRFNQTTDSVEWSSWTWNPVTGCEHGCKFCYAREIANSDRMSAYYPNKFEPTFHEYRLAAPANTPVPESDDARDGRVFVCSMADLFGKWVPDEWINKVFDACLKSPEWTYLFLTKWPERYAKMPLLERAWYGASVIQQSDVSRVEKAMSAFETTGVTKWMSLEPMLGPIKFKDLSWCDLVVIGAQRATTQPDGFVPAFAPKFDWIVDVVNQCRSFNVPYYLKPNVGLQAPGMDLPKSLPRDPK